MLLHGNVQVCGKYTVEDILGEGAFGEVYRVRHKLFGVLAMKVFKYAGIARDEFLSAMKEPVLLSQLNHLNIIRVFDADVFTRGDLSDVHPELDSVAEDKEYGYFTMEYVPTNLEAYWKSYRNRFMPVAEVMDIARQVCEGLAVAHEKTPAILHRDIKPQNILVARAADSIRAVITDFGLATRANPMTLAASLRGTAVFKPPEALADGVDSPASDVWAVGVTLYLLLTDRLPFELDAGSALRIDHSRTVRKPSECNNEVDRHIDEIVLSCLQKEPSQRYRNAREALEALRGWRHVSRAPIGKLSVDTLPVSSDSIAENGEATNGAVQASSSHEDEGELLRQRLEKALDLARSGCDLPGAAELLDEIMQDHPELRKRLSNCAELWRKGVFTPFVVSDAGKTLRGDCPETTLFVS